MPKHLSACLLVAILGGCGTTPNLPVKTAPVAPSKIAYQTQSLNATRQFDRLFQNLDKNGDAGLSLSEFQILLARQPKAAKRTPQVFKRLDSSKDGKLSYAEFEPFWSKYLKAIALRHERSR